MSGRAADGIDDAGNVPPRGERRRGRPSGIAAGAHQQVGAGDAGGADPQVAWSGLGRVIGVSAQHV
ncbi:hypothetical protein C1I99_06135 [Micromonospora deserti]|uniref:Uncharacterized protein n=1 Tax=Micromonospora deserti TaxID=2070366 RepID=A0A2W2DLB9_9ACTN|nr:hypothetical protein C1I99_06135 [Micromonospora deserti]